MTDQKDPEISDDRGDATISQPAATPSPARRKLLRVLAGAGGVVATGALLPEKWSQPLVNRVLIPAHAQATGVSGTYSETQGYDIDATLDIPDQSFLCPLNGVTPAGDGTVTISNLQGDLNGVDKQWTIRLGSIGSGLVLGLTNNGPSCDGPAPVSIFNVTQAQLQAAISGGSIEISAENNGIVAICIDNTMDVTLTFPF